jgi:hypothetical protein
MRNNSEEDHGQFLKEITSQYINQEAGNNSSVEGLKSKRSGQSYESGSKQSNCSRTSKQSEQQLRNSQSGQA